jgi:hypothetical protein
VIEGDYRPGVIIERLDNNVESITMLNIFDIHKKNYHGDLDNVDILSKYQGSFFDDSDYMKIGRITVCYSR